MSHTMRLGAMGLLLMSALFLSGCVLFPKKDQNLGKQPAVLQDISSPEKMLEGYNDLEKNALDAANQALGEANKALGTPPPPPASNFSDLEAQAKEASKKAILNAIAQPGLTPAQKEQLQSALDKLK